MRNKVLSFAMLSLFIFTMGTAAYTQQRVEVPEEKTSQKGFYFRLNLGGGIGTINYQDYYKLKGAGFSFGLRAGGRFSKSFGLHGLVSGVVISNAESDDYTADIAIFTNYGLGFSIYPGGGPFYIMPEIYLANSYGDLEEPSIGLGLNPILGFDWSISRNFALGVAFVPRFGLMVTMDDYDEPIMTTSTFFGGEVSLRFGK